MNATELVERVIAGHFRFHIHSLEYQVAGDSSYSIKSPGSTWVHVLRATELNEHVTKSSTTTELTNSFQLMLFG